MAPTESCDRCKVKTSSSSSSGTRFVLTCELCGLKSHGSCTFPPIAVPLGHWKCIDCVTKCETNKSKTAAIVAGEKDDTCFSCGKTGATEKCGICKGPRHAGCIEEGKCQDCAGTTKQVMKDWSIVFVDRQATFGPQAPSMAIIVIEGRIHNQVERTKEVIGVVGPRTLRMVNGTTVTLLGEPRMAWPPASFHFEHLDAFKNGFPSDWLRYLRPAMNDWMEHQKFEPEKEILPSSVLVPMSKVPPLPSSSKRADDVLPRGSIVCRRFAPGWFIGRVRNTITRKSLSQAGGKSKRESSEHAAQLVVCFGNEHAEVLSAETLKRLQHNNECVSFEADKDGWVAPERDMMLDLINQGCSMGEVSKRVQDAFVYRGPAVNRTAQKCRLKANSLRDEKIKTAVSEKKQLMAMHHSETRNGNTTKGKGPLQDVLGGGLEAKLGGAPEGASSSVRPDILHSVCNNVLDDLPVSAHENEEKKPKKKGRKKRRRRSSGSKKTRVSEGSVDDSDGSVDSDDSAYLMTKAQNSTEFVMEAALRGPDPRDGGKGKCNRGKRTTTVHAKRARISPKLSHAQLRENLNNILKPRRRESTDPDYEEMKDETSEEAE